MIMTDMKHMISLREMEKEGWYCFDLSTIKNRVTGEEHKYFFDVTFSYHRMGDIDPVLDEELFEI
jgi:hypothetical protein